MLNPNCQCGYDYCASWHKNELQVNVPIWRCVSCDAFSGEMGRKEAARYKRQYFSIPKKKRGARSLFSKSYRYSHVQRDLQKEALERSKNLESGHGVCAAPTKGGGPCMSKTRIGTRCHHHRDPEQLTLF